MNADIFPADAGEFENPHPGSPPQPPNPRTDQHRTNSAYVNRHRWRHSCRLSFDGVFT